MIFMIATIRSTEDTIIGFRLLDTNTKDIVDADHRAVVDNLLKNRVCMENLKLTNGEIKGYNGSIDRYSVINSRRELVGEPSIIILSKKSDQILICSDFNGNITEIDQRELRKSTKIANGKIVNNRVSALEGTYKTLDIITNKTIQQKVEEYQAKAKMLGVHNIKIKIQGGKAVLAEVPSGIEKYIIPNFITTIKGAAFDHCTNLRSINIPKNVEVIESSAFYCCDNLNDVTIQNRNIDLMDAAFAWCPFKQLVFPNGIKSIRKNVFNCKESLEILDISNCLETIEESAFSEYIALKQVKLPNGLKKIERTAFGWCESLASIEIPDSVETIGSYAFSRCKSLTKVKLPNNLKEIREGTFSMCASIQEINIPSGVTAIKSRAFERCTSLNNITIPRSVSNISDTAFEGCKHIKKQEFNGGM